MSENQSGRINEFSQYDAMTTEELEEILRLDAEAPEGQESDTETLLYVMGVLADRNRKNGHTENTALEAYESFKQHYMPETEKRVLESEAGHKPKNRNIRCLRSLSAVAAVLVIIFIGSITAKAFGLDIWEAVVTWTQETFHLSGRNQTDGPGKDGELAFDSLQAALDHAGITEALVPTWIPEGYQLTDITVEATPLQNIYTAIYHNGQKSLKLTVRDFLSSAPEYIEQSDDFLEAYEVAGIEYHLFSSYNAVKAVWLKDSFECYISGDITIEELKLMIDSIEKG